MAVTNGDVGILRIVIDQAGPLCKQKLRHQNRYWS